MIILGELFRRICFLLELSGVVCMVFDVSPLWLSHRNPSTLGSNGDHQLDVAKSLLILSAQKELHVPLIFQCIFINVFNP